MTRFPAFLCTLLAVLLLAGCGGDDLPRASSEADDASAETQALIEKADDPDVRTVLDFWRDIQVGALPVAIEGYDPKVRDLVGDETLIEILASQRSLIQPAVPKVVDSRDRDAGHFVVIEGERAGQPALTVSFIVEDGLIRFDSLVSQALPTQLRGELTSGPDAVPRVEAEARARRIVRKYRVLFAGGERE
jgi:hypothetical protein